MSNKTQIKYILITSFLLLLFYCIGFNIALNYKKCECKSFVLCPSAQRQDAIIQAYRNYIRQECKRNKTNEYTCLENLQKLETCVDWPTEEYGECPFYPEE
jgi:hypothetical protein